MRIFLSILVFIVVLALLAGFSWMGGMDFTVRSPEVGWSAFYLTAIAGCCGVGMWHWLKGP